jgi:hypothetical protein
MKQYIVKLYVGGGTTFYGPFPSREAALAWVKERAPGTNFETDALLPTGTATFTTTDLRKGKSTQLELKFRREGETFRVWNASWAGDEFEVFTSLQLHNLIDSIREINKFKAGAISLTELGPDED